MCFAQTIIIITYKHTIMIIIKKVIICIFIKRKHYYKYLVRLQWLTNNLSIGMDHGPIILHTG